MKRLSATTQRIAFTAALGLTCYPSEPKAQQNDEITSVSEDAIVAEGQTTTLRIQRRDPTGDVTLQLSADGSTTRGHDYELHVPNGREEDGHWTLTLPSGQTELELTVTVIDDVAAEPEETIVLRLASSSARNEVRWAIPRNDFTVTNTNDNGEGSLRQAILNAIALTDVEPRAITFDADGGPFATPQTISLETSLPDIVGPVTIDGYIPDRLWTATGVTLSGRESNRIFNVPSDPNAQLTLRHVTIADGRADIGGGILNEGRLIAEGVTFIDNQAAGPGGAIANAGGTATIVNSTFTANSATTSGGAFANLSGDGPNPASASIVNSTFSENGAEIGGALYNEGALRIANNILANSPNGGDCVSKGEIDLESTANLIEANQDCGTPISSEDPKLTKLGYYNGPTQTLPLGGGSPAINLGSNDHALDPNGATLVWDQRGNGDPRFVAGYTDLGAFEHQRFPDLTVDTVDDNGLRACTAVRLGDCPLRAAIELANATVEHDVIRFDPKVFGEPRTLEFRRPLPEFVAPATVDASESAAVTIGRSAGTPLRAISDVELVVIGLSFLR